MLGVAQRDIGVLLGDQKPDTLFSFSRPTIAKISSTIWGARPSEGSSSRIILGRDISARPIAVICCSPPEV